MLCKHNPAQSRTNHAKREKTIRTVIDFWLHRFSDYFGHEMPLIDFSTFWGFDPTKTFGGVRLTKRPSGSFKRIKGHQRDKLFLSWVRKNIRYKWIKLFRRFGILERWQQQLRFSRRRGRRQRKSIFQI